MASFELSTLTFVVCGVEKRVLDQTCVFKERTTAQPFYFSPLRQRKQLATPTYKLCKEKKSSGKPDVLVDPSQVSVVGPVE